MHSSLTPSSTGAAITYLEVATTGNAPAQIWVNTEAAAPAAKPCIRDYSRLVTIEIPNPEALSTKQLKRRVHEVVRRDPRYAEEGPVLLAAEEKRRAAFQQLSIR